MKKVLAAVLAVAMAASMSAVAFATDYTPDAENSYGTETGSSHGTSKDDLRIGREYKYSVAVNGVTLRDDNDQSFTTQDLAYLVDSNKLSSSVIITSGKEKFDSLPTLKTIDNIVQLKVKFKDTYDIKTVSGKVKPRFTAKKDINNGVKVIVKGTDGKWYGLDSSGNATTGHDNKSDAFDDTVTTVHDDNFRGVTLNAWAKDGFADFAKSLYSVVKGGIYTDGFDYKEANLILKKGDTITCPELSLDATYGEIDNYSDSITVTPTEVDDRNVIAKGENLYDNSDSNVTIYFGSTGDVASVKFKVSSAQKDLNLFYKTDEIEDVTNAYDDVDFEFITFYAQNSGANVLTNSGTMTFNAIGGKNTAVYEWNGKTLTELNSKYDSVDDTVEVAGIKRLTTFVVAERKLEAKVEETEAPPATETDAPVTEPVAPPTATPEPDNNQNPNTGAL